MKFIHICEQCSDPTTDAFAIQTELRDDATYEVICPNDHKTVILMQAQKFEVLFELGIAALNDGYPREAVSSFAASLERFYQFYSTVIAIKRGVSVENFQKIWKYVENQSERQFGAYVFSYMLEHPSQEVPVIDNVVPEIPNRTKSNTKAWKAFRNAVIHKGYLPSNEEVHAYTSITYEHIVELLKDLKQNSRDAIGIVHSLPITAFHSKFETENTLVMSEPGPLCVIQEPQWSPATFEEAYKKVMRKSTHRDMSAFPLIKLGS